jgi:hypothetical protein
LNASHPGGWTALYRLCLHKRLKVLRALSDGGWLASADLNQPGVNGVTAVQHLQMLHTATPGDGDVVEMLQLFAAQKQYWTTDARPIVLATLTAHEQLVPDLARLIVEYVDGSGKPFPSSPIISV